MVREHDSVKVVCAESREKEDIRRVKMVLCDY
jgi:hypothetical protein